MLNGLPDDKHEENPSLENNLLRTDGRTDRRDTPASKNILKDKLIYQAHISRKVVMDPGYEPIFAKSLILFCYVNINNVVSIPYNLNEEPYNRP